MTPAPDSTRVVDGAAQHLEARRTRRARPGPPSRARRSPSASPRSRSQARSDTVALLPGMTTTSASAQVGGVGDPPDQHAGLAGQRLHVGRVGDPRQPDRRHPQPRPSPRGGCGSPTMRCGCTDSESSASSHRPSANGHDAVGGPTGEVAQLLQPGRQQGGVAAELVDDEARDEPLVLGFEHRDGAEEVCQQAAAVDVADHARPAARRRVPAPCSPDRLHAG